MKKIVSLAVLSLAMLPVAAQDTYENARLLGSDLNGTARYVGMGGALDALGADVSTINTNPAGIGLFRHSHVSGSFGVVSQQGVSRFDHVNKTNLSFDQIGFVHSFNEGDGRSYVNFAINFHKSRNFDQILSAANSLNRASLSKLAYAKSVVGNDNAGGYYLEENKNMVVNGWRNKTSDELAWQYTQWDNVYTNGLMWDNVNVPAADVPSSPYYDPKGIYFNNVFFEGDDGGICGLELCAELLVRFLQVAAALGAAVAGCEACRRGCPFMPAHVAMAVDSALLVLVFARDGYLGMLGGYSGLQLLER
jgi:hypothetical protein